MGAGPLSGSIAALCDEVAPRLSDAARDQALRVRRRLDEPLRVAIAGRLKAGKSTLVNALIGRRVAPTAVGECTRVVTQFRYGTADRVDVVRRDGSRVSLPLDESGMIPHRLGVPHGQIRHVDVTLTSDSLRTLTVVDTPGLSSTNTAVSEQARRFLAPDAARADVTRAGLTRAGVTRAGVTRADLTAPIDEDLDADSAGAISGAEAVVYVFTQSVRDDDLAALEAFRSVSARLAGNPINSLGLFNKVDKLVSGVADPWPVAGPLAATQAGVLRRVVSDVVPVVGLLAETTEAGRLTAADVEALRALAALPSAERQVLLASVDLFVARPTPVPRDQRDRLLRLLDLYGIGFSLAQLTAHPHLGSGDLVRLLSQASGFPRLRHTLDQAFRWRTDAIKAGWGLAALEKAAGHARPDDREVLRDAIEQVLQRPDYHRLRLLDVAQQVTTGAVELPEPMEQELTRLALSQDPQWILGLPGAGAEQLVKAALDAAARWRVFAVAGATPAQSRVALVAHRGYHLLSHRVRAGGAA